MNKKLSVCFVLTILFLISSISMCNAQDWVLIGEKKVPKKWTSVEIGINDQNVIYKELMFGVQTAAMKAKKIIAIAVDGSVHEYMIDAPTWIEPGENTPPVFLSESGIALKSVKLIFFARKSVIVEFYGKQLISEADQKVSEEPEPE